MTNFDFGNGYNKAQYIYVLFVFAFGTYILLCKNSHWGMNRCYVKMALYCRGCILQPSLSIIQSSSGNTLT